MTLEEITARALRDSTPDAFRLAACECLSWLVDTNPGADDPRASTYESAASTFALLAISSQVGAAVMQLEDLSLNFRLAHEL